MAKRVADQQLTKDGSMSDEDVFSVGSQIGGPQRATAAQMAQRRLAKPRGGRRPGALRPPASPSPGMPPQQQQNPFGEGDRTNMNGTQQQQGGFSFGQQPNGHQPNPNSSSFPPYPSHSFTPSFAAPTSGFNFNANQNQEVNNPFTAINTNNPPPPEPAGFQGSIFTLPAQKLSPFQKFLEGEQKPLFAPGAPDISTSSQSQPPNNFFNQSTSQKEPNQASPGLFSQSNAQQQPSSNAFGQSVEQKAPQPASDMFAHLKTPQNQSSSNPFAQSIAQFQQSQSVQPTANPFAHLGQPQPSSSFLAQGSTSPTQGGSSMMQISPDPSPQSRPFGLLSQPNTQLQSSPTKGSTAESGGGSLFDRISKPPAEANVESAASQTKDGAGQDSGGSLFDRISKPHIDTNAQKLYDSPQSSPAADSGSLSNMPQQPSSSIISNENGVTSPTKIGQRRIAKPTLFQAPSEGSHPSYKAIFGDLKMPATSQLSPSLTTGGALAVPQANPSQSKSDASSPVGGKSDMLSSSALIQQPNQDSNDMLGTHRLLGPPSAPEGYTKEEVRKWYQDWWSSVYVRHKEKRIMNAERQCDEMIKAIREGFDPLEQMASSKRKFVTQDCLGEEDGTQGKRAKVEGASMITQTPRGDSSNGDGLIQSPSKRDAPVQQVTNKNNKRSAEEEPERDSAQGIADKSKKARGHDSVSYPSLPAALSGSQTSSIFQGILDKKEETQVNGTDNKKAAPVFQFPAPSASTSNQSPSPFKHSFDAMAPLLSQHNTESPTKPSFGSSNPVPSTSKSYFMVSKPSSSNSAPANIPAPLFKPTVSSGTPSSASKPSPFLFQPSPSGDAPSDTTKALAAKFSSGGTTLTDLNSTPFSAKPITSGETSSEHSSTTAFKVPTFGATTTSPAAFNSSPFVIKPSTISQNSSEAPKAPALKVPNFSAGASSTNFMSQFGKAAEMTAAEEKKKRKAADYDSDEEDLASWERRDAEEQRLKKQKLEEEIKGKAAKLIDGKWMIAAENDNPNKSAAQREQADPDVSVLSQPRAPLINGYNIFGHLSGEESGAEGSKTGDADDEEEDGNEKDEEEDDDEKDDEETNGQHQVRGQFDDDKSEPEPEGDKEFQAKESKALSNPFGETEDRLQKSPSRNNHDEAEKANGENTGRSLFDRISKDKDGNPVREIPQANIRAGSQISNVFGQSLNSASSSDLSNQPSEAVSIFTSVNSKAGHSPKGDQTWKANTPIKFGDSSNPPAVNVTSPSPSKPTFGGLFGAPRPNITTEAPMKPTSSLFSTPPAKTPSVGFSFGLKPATASLAPPPNNGSNPTSRATSPGATTGDSANESNADGEDDKAEKHEQIDLTSRGPGEENEDIVFQVKAKALVWDTASSSWASKGVGPLRVLKHRESHQTRIILRQDPSGRIVLNFTLSKAFTYESSQSKTVRLPIVSASGKIETWMVKVGNDDDAKTLASALERNKS